MLELNESELLQQEENSDILSLLAEYSAKLRNASEQEIQRKYRRSVTLTVASGLLVISLFVATASFAIPSPVGVDSEGLGRLFLRHLPVGMAAVGLGVSFASVFRLRAMNYLQEAQGVDVEILASLVRRLIEVAVQRREYSNKKISTTFEYDLRVAEAEASLSLAARVFGRLRVLDGVGIEKFFYKKN